MGYGWLVAAMIALIWAFSFVWWRSGLIAAVNILSWKVVSLVIAPAGVCLLAASWARKKYGDWDEDDESGNR